MTTGARPTRILLCSYAFHPSIGGIEMVSAFLAEQLIQRGLEVEVVTHSLDKVENRHEYGYPVHRRPSRGELMSIWRRADLVYQNNIALNYLWPMAMAPKPLVITSQTPIDATIEKLALKRRLKAMVMRLAVNTSCSKYLADTLSVPSRVIYNPLRKLFRIDPAIKRDRELAFVGRLSDSKGVDTLLEALSLLGKKGLKPEVTIVGGGPEEAKLKALSVRLGLDGQAIFVGPKQGPEIAQILNQHQIMVVPSRRKPAEALGIVAMEGIACGCVLVVAEQGGLPEAAGPCGLTFECENPQALAEALEKVLTDAKLREELRQPAPEFLKRFGEETIVEQYLEVFASAMPGGRLSFKSA
jgi:glycogen synthase